VKLLLDTHVWLWSLLDPAQLTARVRSALEDPATELWLSPITTWEVLVLAEKGRLVLELDPVRWVREVFKKVHFREAPLTHEVALRSRALDVPHQDPADRFLAATAAVYELTLVTADERLLGSRMYSVLANT
jgi:PIN domain nuclease of toxin-antitoxin system